MCARKKNEIVEQIIEDIVPSTMDELMGDRFNIYAKDVIQDRAIPDARDGMKPVQRRIIYAMWKSGNVLEKPTKKCAHIVGDVMGEYHPHGDSSIYEALVRMSQKWRVRAPLIDFQGNNGSMDGDGAAAYRYTEARLSAISRELTRDLDKDTVDMGLTFDDSNFEPTVLPSRFPNLFVNGASGIAVGMATEIPPHNLKEVCSAIIYRIQHPSCPIENLMRFVPGPDFPTGGIIYQSQGLKDIYLTGKGRVEIASRTEIVDGEDGLQQIIITEIPYGINKSELVFAIDKIRHDKTIAGIDEVRDETDKTGLRIAVDIKKDFKPEAILSYLLQKTQLRSSYTANMVAIVEGRPVTLNLLSYCDTYIAHQCEVILRRSRFDLGKDQARLEIVEGLIKAASIIDEVIKIIRSSNDKADSKANLIKAFGFTVDQAEAIVMMPLYKLSHTDIAVLEAERDSLKAEIDELNEIISSKEKLDSLIVSDLKTISKVYGDDRRTEIAEDDKSYKKLDERDLIAKETCMLVVTRDGYVKRSSLNSWKGSNGHTGAYPGLKDGDTLIYAGQVETTDFLLLFTSKGQYVHLPVHMIKANKWLEEGLHINYAASIAPDEKIVKAFVVTKFRDDLNIVLLSKNCMIKRTKLSAFPVQRFNKPYKAMKLVSNDQVVGVTLTTGNSNLLVLSSNGLGSFYNENEITLTGTSSSGVKAASFKGATSAAVVAFDPDDANSKVILVTDKGLGRVFSIKNIDIGNRTGKASIIFKTFKLEPHDLVYAEKVIKLDGNPLYNREAPFALKSTLNNGGTFDIQFDDLNLTPMDKVAKVVTSIPKKGKVIAVNIGESSLVNDDTVSFEPPVIEQPEVLDDGRDEQVSEPASSESNELPKEENNKPAEKFEQMSIFSDDE